MANIRCVSVGLSGASGMRLALKVVGLLLQEVDELYLTATSHALCVAQCELGISTLKEFLTQAVEWSTHWYGTAPKANVALYKYHDLTAPMSSGSHPVDATFIAPCSMATVAAIAAGLGDNLVRRMADVALKERRTLILAPREAPFSTLHLENLLKLSHLGAQIFCPMPLWYTKETALEMVEIQIAARLLSLTGIQAKGGVVWQGT